MNSDGKNGNNGSNASGVNNGSNGSYGKNTSPISHASHSQGAAATTASPPHTEHPIIPPRGDYQTLLSFQKAEVVYDITFRFANKYLSKGDRTVDQMIQSARSGKQNFLEGSKAATTSKETEIKLTNVARASLEELLADYRDYLRVRDLPIWEKDSKQALFVRELGRKTPHTRDSQSVCRFPEVSLRQNGCGITEAKGNGLTRKSV